MFVFMTGFELGWLIVFQNCLLQTNGFFFVTHYRLLAGFLLLNTLISYLTLSFLLSVPSSDLSTWQTPTHPSKYRSSFLEEEQTMPNLFLYPAISTEINEHVNE